MRYDVTIGVPVYKSVDYVRRALDSALAQTYGSIEFLIVDDCGCDGSMAVIEEMKYQSHRGSDIHVISNETNKGVSASRNRIIDEAQGTYLYFMDSDDVIAPDTIELLMQAVKHHDAEIAFGSYERIEVSGERQIYQYPDLQLLRDDQLACFAFRKYAGIQASACNYLVKTSLVRDAHLRFVEADYWEDMVFTYQLVTHVSRAVLLSDITYFYFCHQGSLSHYQAREKILKQEILQNAKTIEHLKKTAPILYNKVYYPEYCNNVVMTDFYIVCNILKRRKDIVPPISAHEMRAIMSHPATLRQICSFQKCRLKNLSLYLLSVLPPFVCVGFIWFMGKMKKLV